MTSFYDDTVKQGYLKIHGKKLKRLSVKKRWVLLRHHSSRGPLRLELYVSESAFLTNQFAEPIKKYPLIDVSVADRVEKSICKYGFRLKYHDGRQRIFATESDFDANQWMEMINEECRQHQQNPLDILDMGPQQIDHADRFHVYLLTSPFLPFNGECLMQVTTESVLLLDVLDPRKKLVTWPIAAISRYKRDATKFMVETGRRCETGQGAFVFNTTDGDALYKKLHTAAVMLAETRRWDAQLQKDNSPQLQQSPHGSLPPLPVDASPIDSYFAASAPVGPIHAPSMSSTVPLNGPPVPPRHLTNSLSLPATMPLTKSKKPPPPTLNHSVSESSGDRRSSSPTSPTYYDRAHMPLPPIPGAVGPSGLKETGTHNLLTMTMHPALAALESSSSEDSPNTTAEEVNAADIPAIPAAENSGVPDNSNVSENSGVPETSDSEAPETASVPETSDNEPEQNMENVEREAKALTLNNNVPGASHDDSDEDYIYDQKGLNPAFRKYINTDK